LKTDLRSDMATIHSEFSLSYTIETVDKPINCFNNQILIEEGTAVRTRPFVIFGNRSRHAIQFLNNESLVDRIRDVVKQGVTNAIYCKMPILAFNQNHLVEEFRATTFRHTNKMVTDIYNNDEQST